MPLKELLIRKIYTKLVTKLKSDLDLNDPEKITKVSTFNRHSPFRNQMIPDDTSLNGINKYLYSKVIQTPKNTLLYNVLIKSEYNDIYAKDVNDFYSGNDYYRSKDNFCDNYEFINLKINDSFGEVWSLFAIKMNFID